MVAGSSEHWHEAHNSKGATEPGRRWAIAEGELDAATGAETFVLVANTSAHPASVASTFLFGDGIVATTILELAPKSRGNARFPVLDLNGQRLRYSVIVESMETATGEVADIVVARAMYRDGGGVRWQAGATRLAREEQHAPPHVHASLNRVRSRRLKPPGHISRKITT